MRFRAAGEMIFISSLLIFIIFCGYVLVSLGHGMVERDECVDYMIARSVSDQGKPFADPPTEKCGRCYKEWEYARATNREVGLVVERYYGWDWAISHLLG